jgi:hypothetical protein
MSIMANGGSTSGETTVGPMLADVRRCKLKLFQVAGRSHGGSTREGGNE